MNFPAAEPIASLPAYLRYYKARYLGSARHGTSTSSIWHWPCPVAVADHLQSSCSDTRSPVGQQTTWPSPYRRMHNSMAG